MNDPFRHRRLIATTAGSIAFVSIVLLLIGTAAGARVTTILFTAVFPVLVLLAVAGTILFLADRLNRRDDPRRARRPPDPP